VIFDTDILIWVQRGNKKASHLIDASSERFISAQTYLELLQCAPNKEKLGLTKSFISDLGFTILPLSENIGYRAIVYLEEYGLSSGLRAGDAIIAATATENNLPLTSGNGKHFKALKDLKLKVFKP